MDSLSFLKTSFACFLSLSLCLHAVLGEIVCETLSKELCAFSIASSGKRCLLENYATPDRKTGYECRTSEVVVENMAGYIESDKCINSCGVDRKSVGISSDSLLDPHATVKICSPNCYQNCPNIVDLYFNLAAGEGVFLPDLCEVQLINPHRAMIQLLSSGVAQVPVGSAFYAGAPMDSSFFADAPSESFSFSPEPSVPSSF